jgi:hypothetical protein
VLLELGDAVKLTLSPAQIEVTLAEIDIDGDGGVGTTSISRDTLPAH